MKLNIAVILAMMTFVIYLSSQLFGIGGFQGLYNL